MKDKVTQAIKSRARARINDEATKVRRTVMAFHEMFGVTDKKTIANNLRALADNIDDTAKAWVICKYIWDYAEKQAYEDFMNQFDALTRFVNRGITHEDGNCAMPDQEENIPAQAGVC